MTTRRAWRGRPRTCPVLTPDGPCLSLLAVRPDHHDHVPAILLGLRLNETKFLDVTSEPLQQFVAELRPALLAPAEHDGHLDLVALLEEPLDVALLGPVVVRVDLRADLDFLDDGLSLVLARFPGLERRLVLELAVVHQLADRRSRGRRDFDQVEVCFLSKPEGV